jgi:phosphate transport system ATP-binding protein
MQHGAVVASSAISDAGVLEGMATDVRSVSPSKKTKGSFVLNDVSVAYSGDTVVAGVSCSIESRSVTSLIGPSGCGKSTLLRCFNRMNDKLGDVAVGGSILLDGEDIYSDHIDPVELRMRVGQVFQHPTPLPMSIYDNIAYGPRLRGAKRAECDEIVETCLKRAALWDEVKDDLRHFALALSGGQQQRLCIARALATSPEVLLMDEPCSALDPISTSRVEETVMELRESMTIVIVTHSMQEAQRVSDNTMFMLRESMDHPAGLIEWGPTEQVFNAPRDQRTADYISGRFG